MDGCFANLQAELTSPDHYFRIGKPIIRLELQQFVLVAPNDFRFGVNVADFESEKQAEECVINR